MTKEMRPAHRIDVLSSALIYYGIQTKEKLGKEVAIAIHLALIKIITNNYFSFFICCTMGKGTKN